MADVHGIGVVADEFLWRSVRTLCSTVALLLLRYMLRQLLFIDHARSDRMLELAAGSS